MIIHVNKEIQTKKFGSKNVIMVLYGWPDIVLISKEKPNKEEPDNKEVEQCIKQILLSPLGALFKCRRRR